MAWAVTLAVAVTWAGAGASPPVLAAADAGASADGFGEEAAALRALVRDLLEEGEMAAAVDAASTEAEQDALADRVARFLHEAGPGMPRHGAAPVHAGQVYSFNLGNAVPGPLGLVDCVPVLVPGQAPLFTPNAEPRVDVGVGVHVVFTEAAAGLNPLLGLHLQGSHVGSNCVRNSGWGSTVFSVGAFRWS